MFLYSSPIEFILRLSIEVLKKIGFKQNRLHYVQTKKSVIGSEAAGLAAAARLSKVGDNVSVYERDDRIGVFFID